MRPSALFLIRSSRVLLHGSRLARRLLVLVILATTLPLSSATSGDKTNLLARHTGAGSGGWVTDVLVVTTSVRVLDRVHGTATDLWPAVALDPVLVRGTAGVLHPLLGARWETKLVARLLNIVGDDGAVVARAAGNDATVARLGLHVGDDHTLRHGHHWQSVANDELGLLSAVDDLPGVGALHGWEQLLVDLVGAGIVEVGLDERGATARIVNDVLHDTLNEPIALAVVEHTELGGTLAGTGVRFEDGPTALTLTANNTTHL